MSENQQLNHHPNNCTISSEMNQKLLKKETWRTNRPSVQLASATVDLFDTIEMIDTFDRPADASAEGTYARTGSYAVAFENKPMKRIPKAGAFAEAGVGRAGAEFSVFEAEAKGPNASAGAEAGQGKIGAMARAEVGSVSAKAGPLDMRLGFGVDTGASIGPDGLELKFLGTGITVGPRTGVSVLRSEVSCSIQ